LLKTTNAKFIFLFLSLLSISGIYSMEGEGVSEWPKPGDNKEFEERELGASRSSSRKSGIGSGRRSAPLSSPNPTNFCRSVTSYSGRVSATELADMYAEFGPYVGGDFKDFGFKPGKGLKKPKAKRK